jgi:RimJ/RimL family protein N-acetyltransferase
MRNLTPHQPLAATGGVRGPGVAAAEIGDRGLIARPRPLATDRLILEPWHPRHRAAWRQLCREPAVMRYVGSGETWETAKADEIFDAMVAHWQEHGFGWRSALHWATGTWLGCVGLNRVGHGLAGIDPDEVVIGWWLVRPAWGHGYASEGAAGVVEEAFGRLALDRLIAPVQPADRASARVARRIGMRPDGDTTGSHGEMVQVYALAADTRPGAPGPVPGISSSVTDRTEALSGPAYPVTGSSRRRCSPTRRP